MATKTDIYELRKKEENDFYTIDDFNDNMDTVETALTTFDDTGTVEGITSFTDMLTKMVTGNKLAITLRNLKAGLQYVLHTGSIVNNCVTDNANLPLAAAQGKALQDQLTKLNSESIRFINTSRVIVNEIRNIGNNLYTATEDCFIVCILSNVKWANSFIDNKQVSAISDSTTHINYSADAFLKKGQAFKIQTDVSTCRVMVYGLSKL